MNLPASLYTRTPRKQASRRELTQEDLFLYEALLGRPAEFVEPPEELSLSAGLTPIKTIARQFKPSVVQMTVRLRTMYQQGVAASANHEKLTDWLRHMSNQAFTRLDEAQARLHAARVTPPNRRRVDAREVMAIHPENLAAAAPASPKQEHHYKRVA